MFNPKDLIESLGKMSTKEVMSLSAKYCAGHYNQVPFAPIRTDGVWLYDKEGNKKLDLMSAYSAVNQGHHNKQIAATVKGAIDKKMWNVTSGVVYNAARARLAEMICEMLPQLAAKKSGKCGNKVLFKNGGVDSVETALKIAKSYGHKIKGIPDGKQEIIVMKNNFHGRTMEVVSFSSNDKYKKGFGARTNGYVEVPFNDYRAVLNAINDNTCAILVEPWQGEGGMYRPDDTYLTALRHISNNLNVLLIYDEIQVGLGRTGKMFCFQHYKDAEPDVLILGKALSGGYVPVSCVVTSASLMDELMTPGRDGSTFGGYSGACIDSLAALSVLISDKLVENAERMGRILMKGLKDIARKSKVVKEVRGGGLFIGVEVVDGDASKYCKRLFDLGILANDSHGKTIRVSPPLVINEKHVKYILDRFEKALV